MDAFLAILTKKTKTDEHKSTSQINMQESSHLL